MKFGYARVSTKDQHLSLQVDALRKEGCKKIFQEIAKGSSSERLELNKLLGELRRGDVIVIWKLDRLGRSLKHVVNLVAMLLEKGVGLKSLNDPIDTTSSQGRLIFNIFACLAEFERDLIVERTQAGLRAARARGRLGGRPKGLTEAAKRKAIAAAALYKEGKLSINEIRKNLGICKATLYNYLRHQGIKIGLPTRKEPQEKTMPISVWLRVENNNKFVRGKKRSIEDIENYVFSEYDMKKLSDYEYKLTIPYETDEDLEETVYEILRDADRQADMRHCFIETDVRALDGSEKSW